MRRYFLRAGAADPEALGQWCDAWTERIAVLYRAHHVLAATTPGTGARQDAAGRWQRAFTDIDAHLAGVLARNPGNPQPAKPAHPCVA